MENKRKVIKITAQEAIMNANSDVQKAYFETIKEILNHYEGEIKLERESTVNKTETNKYPQVFENFISEPTEPKVTKDLLKTIILTEQKEYTPNKDSFDRILNTVASEEIKRNNNFHKQQEEIKFFNTFLRNNDLYKDQIKSLEQKISNLQNELNRHIYKIKLFSNKNNMTINWEQTGFLEGIEEPKKEKLASLFQEATNLMDINNYSNINLLEITTFPIIRSLYKKDELNETVASLLENLDNFITTNNLTDDLEIVEKYLLVK